METLTDPTGILAQCMERLLSVGFDHDTFYFARWAGVALLVCVTVFPLIRFLANLWTDRFEDPVFTELQFRYLSIGGMVLVALPLVTQFAASQFEIELSSQDRDYAQRVCEDQIDTTTSSAALAALTKQVTEISLRLEELNQPTDPVLASQPPSAMVTKVETAQPLLGDAISVFYRPEREADAEKLAEELTILGAGVAIRQTDLSESSISTVANPGQNFILFSGDAADDLETVGSAIDSVGLELTETRGPFLLRGNNLQILMF